jgi:glutathione S-transferase
MRAGQTTIPQDIKDRLYQVLDTLESFLDGFDWFSATENVSLADLSILAEFSTIYHVGLDLTNHPNLAAWYERCQELPGAADNEKGAKMFASMVKSKLTEPL